MATDSPLRYPGGKARLANYMQLLLLHNQLRGCHYVEPYTGGGSVALALLYQGYASHIHINDLDRSIYAFWHSVLHQNDAFCTLIQNATLTIDEWHRQRSIYRSDETDLLRRGFATFYLNRTNRSGIIGNASVIGGLAQTGAWKIDARFGIPELVRRIKKIGAHQSQITLTNLDALDLLQTAVPSNRQQPFVYLDPPYYEKGQRLYANAYQPSDHAAVAAAVAKLKAPWVVSYDDHPAVRALYALDPMIAYGLRYTAKTRYQGAEVMFFSRQLRIPDVKHPIVTSKQLRSSPSWRALRAVSQST